MGGRIYTDIVSIGAINVYEVVVDPNGLLDAPYGSIAILHPAPPISPTTFENVGGTVWLNTKPYKTRRVVAGIHVVAVDDDFIVRDTTAGPVSLLLPASVGGPVRPYTAKKITGDANNVAWVPAGADLVDNGPGPVWNIALVSLTVQNEGNGNWWVK